MGTSCPPPLLAAPPVWHLWKDHRCLQEQPDEKTGIPCSANEFHFICMDNTVSKARLRSFSRHCSRNSAARVAALKTASGAFQSPNSSRAMKSGLIYTQPPIHSCEELLSNRGFSCPVGTCHNDRAKFHAFFHADSGERLAATISARKRAMSS